MTHISIGQPDVTLRLDFEGVIRDASLSRDILGEGLGAWVGRAWTETVGDLGIDRVRRMVEDARSKGVSAFRQVTQRFPSGLELPIEYTTVRLGSKAGLIAVGKNLQAVAELQSRLLAAQQAREQDYWRLREIETRSRLLFDASSEAMLVVRAETLSIMEANPTAIRTLGLAPGWDFLREMAPHDQESFQDMLLRVREHGRAPGVVVHLGSDHAPWAVRASLMTADPGPLFLLQLMPVGAALQSAERDMLLVPLEEILERMPDGFAIINEQGLLTRANRAFLDMIGVAGLGAVHGEPIRRWLTQPGADASTLLSLLRQHGSVSLFTTILTGELGAETPVEISAFLRPDTGPGETGPAVALVVRDVGRRLPFGETDRLASTIAAVSNQIGSVPLPTLVRGTAALVERHCIELALERVGGKRTAAAELLGVSRQSLYVKLNRYGLEDGSTSHADERE